MTVENLHLGGPTAGGDVGETVRSLRSRLERGLPLTGLQEERWGRLLEHNLRGRGLANESQQQRR